MNFILAYDQEYFVGVEGPRLQIRRNEETTPFASATRDFAEDCWTIDYHNDDQLRALEHAADKIQFKLPFEHAPTSISAGRVLARMDRQETYAKGLLDNLDSDGFVSAPARHSGRPIARQSM